MSKSTYCYYKEIKHLRAEKRRMDKDSQILTKVKKIYIKSRLTYGYRRIILSLTADDLKELNVGRDRIIKVLRDNNLFGKQGRNHHYHSYKGDNGLDKRNLLLTKEVDEVTQVVKYVRHFETTRPNEKWTTDVSEFKIPMGKVYLSPILDMFDSSIIAYDISTSPNLEQSMRMLKKAFKKYKHLEGLIFHSDQGWQYQHQAYIKELKKRGIKQSFSRKGNCMDNSLMENFFGILKNEMFYGHEDEFNSLNDLIFAIEDYIKFYNEIRINVKRKGLSPFEYRQQSLSSLQC